MKTAVQYLFYAAAGTVALSSQAGLVGDRLLQLIVTGSALFSGSLFALVLSDVKKLGAVTPIGGTLMMAGFALAAYRAARN